jgi:hypothetical protein
VWRKRRKVSFGHLPVLNSTAQAESLEIINRVSLSMDAKKKNAE